MKIMIAAAAVLLLGACGERMDSADNAVNALSPQPASDIATNASAVADYARREISAVAPEIVNPGRTLNGRICAAAMARVTGSAEKSIKLESVDGNTTRLLVGTSRRDCLVDGDIIVWREIPETGGAGDWKDTDKLRYKINKQGDIEIVGNTK